jgi:hypothetical protein
MIVPAATVITLARVRPMRAPACGKYPGTTRPAALVLLGFEPEPEPPVFCAPVVCAVELPELPPPDAVVLPVTVLPPETDRMPLEIVETVLQLEDEGVLAAVEGVTVVPTVYETGVPLLVKTPARMFGQLSFLPSRCENTD